MLDRLLALPPTTVYLTILGLAALENVFPPVPADTAVVLGAFLSRDGGVDVRWVLVATLVGNLSTAALVYGAARTAGRGFVTKGWGGRLVPAGAWSWVERQYQRHGLWGIFVSRFVPGVRAVVPPFAGIAGVGPARALIPTFAASAIYYSVLALVAARVAEERDDAVRLVGQVNVGAVILGVCVVVAVLVLRRRRAA